MTPRIITVPRPSPEEAYVVMINDHSPVETYAQKLVIHVLSNVDVYIGLALSHESASINLAEESFKELSRYYPHLAISVLGWGMVHTFDDRVDKRGPDDLLVRAFTESNAVQDLESDKFINSRSIYQKALKNVSG